MYMCGCVEVRRDYTVSYRDTRLKLPYKPYSYLYLYIILLVSIILLNVYFQGVLVCHVKDLIYYIE